MKILIIRHADPYYPTDSLTEKGTVEAELLSQKLAKENITKIFVSPHGRAKLTAMPTATKFGIEPTVLDWLKEFPPKLTFSYNTDFYKDMYSPWNMPPELWTDDNKLYNIDNWQTSEIFNKEITSYFNKISENFDKLLFDLGYEKCGNYYKISESNENEENTIALFCHFGIGTALIAHILNMPLIPIWNSIFLPPSSVTCVYMERHNKENKSAHPIFVGIGDTSHLYKLNEPISCSGLHTKNLK